LQELKSSLTFSKVKKVVVSMQKNMVRGIFLTGAITLVLSGCGDKPTNNGTKSQGSAPAASSSQTIPPPAAVQPQAPAEKAPIQHSIKAYYGDDQATKLVEKEVSINYKEEKDKYMTALWTLKKAPANSGKLAPLAESLGFKTAVLKDKKLTVDLTISKEGRLGAPGEQLLLQAIQKTIFQFPEVDSIDILVDGKAVESLMGHMDLPHPMKR
jgi:spore germination protein GerM